MGKRINSLLGLAVVASVAGAAPAEAAMGCWDGQAATSVRLKDFQSRLMVATLRCNAMGFDSSAHYNKFMIANKATLGTANVAVKARFQAAYGAKRWQSEYDRFNTSLANAYGAGATSKEICRDLADTARNAAAAKGDRAKLMAIVEHSGSAPSLPGGMCRGASLAMR